MTSPSTAAYEMTAEKFFQLPEGPPYFELIDGDLYMSPSPLRLHQRILLSIAHDLQGFLDDQPLGEIYISPSDVVFGQNVVLNPDLYYVRNEHRSILKDHGATGAPDLVVEILSPSTASRDVGRKREIYAESGVEEFWVVAPKTRTVEIYRLRENPTQPVVMLSDTDTLTSALFPGWNLAIADVFRE